MDGVGFVNYYLLMSTHLCWLEEQARTTVLENAHAQWLGCRLAEWRLLGEAAM
jgi:hypothetical protein